MRTTNRVARAIGSIALAAGLASAAGGCAGTTDLGVDSFVGSRNAPQTAPVNYRDDILTYLRSYLNDPTNIRNAQIAEPMTRSFGSETRYVVCLRYNARASSGRYTGLSDRLAVFLNGRFDHYLENGREACAGVAYAPFPELERLMR